ncbi:hypothetical protein [Microbacterium sp. P02]|uniref:hypothetical protein n=1 Tax=Microbacterium sp. P02 TaxID=3366260 RepID=UPI0036718B3D
MTLPISGGIGVATTTNGGAAEPAGFFADILRSSAESAWAEGRPRLEKQLKDLLGQGDLIHAGFTLYDITLHLSPDLSFTIDRNAPGDLVVTVTTGGNYVEATSTQPTALGEWADPRVSVAFGLTFSYVLDIPPLTGAVSATGFRDVRVLNPLPDSHNLVADIAFFLNDLVDFFGGSNLLESVRAMVSSMDFSGIINGALAPLNAKLAELAAEGFWFLDLAVDQLDGTSGSIHGLSIPGATPDRLDVLLVARALDRSGIVEGEISWPRALGRPMLAGMMTDSIDIAGSTAAVMVGFTRSDTVARFATLPLPARPADAPAPVLADTSGAPAPALDSPLDVALSQLPDAERAAAVGELRQGAASRFVSLVGSATATLALNEFARGRTDFTVEATTPVGGTGLFPDMRVVSQRDGLWAADDATTCCRRFRLVDVATDVALTITAAVAPRWEWNGPDDQVVVVSAGWKGTVTVEKGDPASHPKLIEDFRRFTRERLTLEDGVGGAVRRPFTPSRSDETSLNPQPLPPVEVQLNPQPLPPVEVRVGVSDGILSTLRGRASVSDAVIGGMRNEAVLSQVRLSDHVDQVIDADRVDLTRFDVQNPSGRGLVGGIDFTVRPYVAPVVR